MRHVPPHHGRARSAWLRLPLALVLVALTMALCAAAQEGATALAAPPAAEPESVTKVLVLRYAKAGDVLPPVWQVLGDKGSATGDVRTNSLVVTGPEDLLGTVMEVVRQLDVQTEAAEPTGPAAAAAPRDQEVRVYALRYAQAAKIQASVQHVVGDRGRVTVDARTNSLVIAAPADAHDTVKQVVALLDSASAPAPVEVAAYLVAADTRDPAQPADDNPAIQFVPSGPEDGVAAPVAAVDARALKAAVDKAEALLRASKTEYERVKGLAEAGLVSQGDVEAARAEYRTLQSDVAIARARAEGGPAAAARVAELSVERARTLVERARARLEELEARAALRVVPQADLDAARLAVETLEADLAAASALAGALQGAARPDAGLAGVLDPAYGLPMVPLGPYVDGPDGTPHSPVPGVDQLLDAAATTYTSYPNGPGPIPSVLGALAGPQFALVTADGPAARLALDWPSDAPTYYLEKGTGGPEGPGTGYTRVELADRAGFSGTLTREEREGLPVIALELVRLRIEAGDLDAETGAPVGRPQVLRTTCTASAPIVPGLTTVMTWGLLEEVPEAPLTRPDGDPSVLSLPVGVPGQLRRGSPCLQIRMRLAGSAPTTESPAALLQGPAYTDWSLSPDSLAAAPTLGDATSPVATERGALEPAPAGTAPAVAQPGIAILDSLPAVGQPITDTEPPVWRALVELEVGSPEWVAVNTAADPCAELLAMLADGRVTASLDGYASSVPLVSPGIRLMHTPGLLIPADPTFWGAPGTVAAPSVAEPTAPLGPLEPPAGANPLDAVVSPPTTEAAAVRPLANASPFSAIEGDEVSVEVTRFTPGEDGAAALVGLAVSCTLKRAALRIGADAAGGPVELPAGMSIQFTSHPVVRVGEHCCLRGLCFLRFTPDGEGVSNVVAKEAFLILKPVLVLPLTTVPGGEPATPAPAPTPAAEEPAPAPTAPATEQPAAVPAPPAAEEPAPAPMAPATEQPAPRTGIHTDLRLVAHTRPSGDPGAAWTYLCRTPGVVEVPPGHELSLSREQSYLTGGELVDLTLIGDAQLAQLTRDFAGANLTRLDLGGAEVTDDGLAYIARIPHLTDLSLAACRGITDSGLAHLEPLTGLTRLDLGDTQVTDWGLAHLEGLTNLTDLSLRDTEVTDEGMVHLEGLSGLTRLNLWSAPVTGAGLVHRPGLANLTALDMGYGAATDEGLLGLEGLPKLRDLRLNCTGVTDAGLAHLRGLRDLAVLDLSQTRMTDSGLAHLAGLSNLAELWLEDDGVTDAGLARLEGLANLTKLYLAGTKLTDAGLAHLQGLVKLADLGLSETALTGTGLAHLAGLANLRSLGLSETGVTDESLAQLEGLAHLTELWLGSTGITDAGLVHLEGSGT
jgi:Leucine-rich repeat (LRR) protein